MRNWLMWLIGVALILGAVAAKGLFTAAPPLSARTTAFDQQRAAQRLTRVLGDQRPHPVDSAANDAVRERLLAELRLIGLAPRVTNDFVCTDSSKGRSISCARTRNIVATIGGGGGKHVLLVTHYDSSPLGPGASDAGIGVATLLEVGAALARRPLPRPVTLLLTDGEELGLLGARAFLERDPLVEQVDTLLNFEARGVEGPAIMFETSAPIGVAIDLFTNAVERPRSNSLTTAIYELLPNSTDVAIFKDRKNWTILNFAVVGNETRYHSAGDTLAALDRRSLQHMGDQALAATEAAVRATPSGAGQTVFTDVLGRAMIALPLPLAIGAMLVLLAGAGWNARQRGIGRALAAIAMGIAGAAAITFAIQWLAARLVAGEYWRARPDWIDLAMIATSLLVVQLALGWSRRDTALLRAAFWLVFALLGAVMALAMPAALPFFVVPAVAAIVGGPLRRVHPALPLAGSILGALLLYFLWVPFLGLALVTLDRDLLATFAPMAAMVMLPWLIELQPLAARLPARSVAAALATVAFAAWVVALAVPDYSANRKQHFGIEQAIDADRGEGRWSVYNDGASLPSGFNGFTRTKQVPWSLRPRWLGLAQPELGNAPSLTVIGARTVKGGKIVSLRIAANGNETITLRGPKDARLSALRANGRQHSLGNADSKGGGGSPRGAATDLFIRCGGRSCDGLRLDLKLDAKPRQWTLIGSRRGLPASAAPLIAARPGNAQPQYAPDAVISYRRVRL